MQKQQVLLLVCPGKIFATIFGQREALMGVIWSALKIHHDDWIDVMVVS